MKSKIYPFLLGLSCIVIVALVSFKAVATEKEFMTISIGPLGLGKYTISISTEGNYEEVQVKGQPGNFSALIGKIQAYQKEGWSVKNSTQNYYLLERDKK